MNASSDIGLIGLAVMGENLALNIESKGFPISVFNRTVSKVDEFIGGRAKGKKFFGAHSLAEIAEELEARGITVIIKGVQPEHMTLLANMGIVDALRHENHLIDSLDAAVAHARSHVQGRLNPSGT